MSTSNTRDSRDTTAALALVQRIREEGPLSMADAAVLFGLQSNGKYRSVQTIAAYCSRGVGGIFLEGYHGPGGWVTSAAAIERFLAARHQRMVQEDERLFTPGAVERKARRKGAGGESATAAAKREFARMMKDGN